MALSRFLPLLLTGLLACTTPAVEPDLTGGDTPDQNPAGMPTAVGQPVGAATTQTIGPAGGALTSSDGKLTLNFPAGALAKETPVSIQPIENKAFGGVGAAYRLLPADATYQKAATATWQYTDADVNGSTPDALGMAAQQANGVWLGRALKADKTKKQVTASITRPRDIAYFEQFFLRPSQPQVLPNEPVEFQAYYLKNFSGNPDENWFTLSQPEPTGLAYDWMVNGVPANRHQNAELGQVSLHDDSRMLLYRAPQKSPGSPIAISTRIVTASKVQLTLVSNVSVYSGNSCTVDGKNVSNAPVSFAVSNGVLTGMIAEKGMATPGAILVGLAVENFKGTGTYEVNKDTAENRNKLVGITAYTDDKQFTHFYRDDMNQWISGGGKITITEYVPGKLIVGSVSGGVFYTTGKKSEFKSISCSASFRAWIN